MRERDQAERAVLRALWEIRREAYVAGALDDNFRAPLNPAALAWRAGLPEHRAMAAVQALARRGAVVLYFITLTSAGPMLRLWRGGEPETRVAEWLFGLHPATLWKLNGALLAN